MYLNWCGYVYQEVVCVQLLVAYGADVAGMEDPTALLEVSAFSLFLELDDAVTSLLQQCNSLSVDLDQPLSQGAASFLSCRFFPPNQT